MHLTNNIPMELVNASPGSFLFNKASKCFHVRGDSTEVAVAITKLRKLTNGKVVTASDFANGMKLKESLLYSFNE